METGISELEYNGTTSQIPHGIAEVLNLNFVQVAENLKGTHSTNTHPNQSPQSPFRQTLSAPMKLKSVK